MKAYITFANMRKSTPIEFTGELINKLAGYYEPFTRQDSEIWETDQTFDFQINGMTVKTNKITIYK